MPTQKNTNYSLIYVLLAMALICCLTVAGPRIIQPAINKFAGNIVLRDFKAAFQEIQHPADTEQLSVRTAMGEFADGGQGCDFFVGEIRRYDGREEDISAAYVPQEISGNPLRVLFLEEGGISDQTEHSLPEVLDELAAWDLPSEARQRQLYMVYLIVVDYEGDFRLECR
jgi:hypothetical protein